MQFRNVCFAVPALFALMTAAHADTYFVATWGRDDNPGTSGSPWSLRRAAADAAAGDTVIIRGGTYAEVLHPEHAGTSGSRLSFCARAGESPVITGRSPDDRPVVIDTDYVTIEGLGIRKASLGTGKQFDVLISGDHTIVRNCSIVGSDPVGDRQRGSQETGIRILKPSFDTLVEGCEIAGLSHVGVHIADGATRVIIRDNVLHDHYLDAVRFDHSQGRLREGLVERNVIYGSVISDGIQFNGDFASPAYPEDESNCGTVIRENLIFGNAENGVDLKGTCRVVVEDNVIYGNRGDNDGDFDDPPTCGSESADRCGGIGGIMKGGVTTSRDVIVRRNIVYDNRGGIAVAGAGWTVYNNTVVANDRDFTGSNSAYSESGKPYFLGIYVIGAHPDTSVKNNIVGDHSDVELRAASSGIAADIDGNMYFNASGPRFSYLTNPWRALDFDGWRQTVSGWGDVTGHESNSFVVGDPVFHDVPAHPVMGGTYDFRPASSSPAIDAGVPLTRTTSAGSGQVVAVGNARYFSDGMNVVEGDRVQIEGADTAARIVAVDYGAGRLTLDRALSWRSGAGVQLLYAGEGPDIGALEFDGAAVPGNVSGAVGARAVVDIYQVAYGRFDFTLTNDPASASAIVRAVMSVSGTELDAIDTSGALTLSPAGLGSNNSVTSPEATISFSPGLAPGESAFGEAGDFDPHAVPSAIDMTVTFADGSVLTGAFERDDNVWTWAQTGGTSARSASPLIVHDCADSAAVGFVYSCAAAVADLDGGAPVWSLDPSSTCGFLSVDGTTGAVSGVPSSADIGDCTVTFAGTGETYRATATVSIRVSAPEPVRVAASAVLDIYQTDYGRFDFTLTNDAASGAAIIRAVVTAAGTEFDAFDTRSDLTLSPASLTSNNSVTSPTATVTFSPGLSPGQSAFGKAGDFDPHAAPTAMSMELTFADESTLGGNFVYAGGLWTWSASGGAAGR